MATLFTRTMDTAVSQVGKYRGTNFDQLVTAVVRHNKGIGKERCHASHQKNERRLLPPGSQLHRHQKTGASGCRRQIYLHPAQKLRRSDLQSSVDSQLAASAPQQRRANAVLLPRCCGHKGGFDDDGVQQYQNAMDYRWFGAAWHLQT